MKGLTKRQSEILTLIRSISQTKGYVPSYRELMKALGLSSPGTLYKHMKNLRERGYAQPETQKIVQKASSTVPIIGQIARREKIELFAKVSLFELPPSWQGHMTSNLYGFVVKDQSFANLQMQRGDLLLVDTASTPQNGEMLLAKFAKSGTQIGRYLITYNERLLQADEPLSLDEEGVQIHGVIITLLRSYSLPEDKAKK